jgi:hypothetical protein
MGCHRLHQERVRNILYRLDDNSHLEVLTNSPELTQIIFAENKVAQLDTVLKLKSLAKLVEIDFEGNPVTSNPDYFKSVF